LNRKTIVTNMAVVACDVCGRTLLRGENADVFLHGGSRRTVCELCTTRAMHEGWIREGLDDALGHRSPERGAARSLLGRLRSRRTDRGDGDVRASAARAAYPPASYDPDHYAPGAALDEPGSEQPVIPEPAPPAAAIPAPAPAAAAARADDVPRERGISAVPTNAERKVARALEVFNVGVHTRTVAGVARSLGSPLVSARPSATEGSVVTIVVAWELSWYRYEVDLGDEASGVRVTGQGTELSELPDEDRTPTATADEGGFLHPRAELA
jgi:hypothetical protein